MASVLVVAAPAVTDWAVTDWAAPASVVPGMVRESVRDRAGWAVPGLAAGLGPGA
ncbi:hypothetical protein ACWDV4_08135 [Micromonospora sp. NPDC003197]